MNKKLYIAPTTRTVEMETSSMLAASGEITENSATGGVDITMPDGEATVDQDKLMSLDDPHLWN